MTQDRHIDLGRKEWVTDEETLIFRIRSVWPDAWAEGSTGPERSWWTKDTTAPDFGTISGIGAMIAHSWPKRTGGFWLRLRMK